MYYGYYYFDWTYLLVIIGVVLCLLAQMRVQSTFRKFEKVQCRNGMTGAEAAYRILRYAGITDVKIERISGSLTDHYDPRTKTLRLSDSVYGKSTVSAIGVAAHECGHAVQHQKNYAPLQFRSALVPVANLGSSLAWPLIIIGVILGGMVSTGFPYWLIMGGILLFTLAVLFQIVTLPVEFNASSRALKVLESTGILCQDEIGSARKVLGAAALTYVASAASAILQLLRLLILFGGRRRD